MRDSSVRCYPLVSSLFRAVPIEPKYVQLVGQVHTALALVSAGIGVALVPEAARSLLVCGVVLRELRPHLQLQADLHLVWSRELDNAAFRSLQTLVSSELELNCGSSSPKRSKTFASKSKTRIWDSGEGATARVRAV